MTFERPQKGNPHHLTMRQHTFPRASVARFANSDGLVSVQHIKSGKCFRVAAKNKLFCAMRVWDQRAEAAFNDKIEKPFQLLAETILDETVCIISPPDQLIVNAFFALCNVRSEWKSRQVPSRPAPGIVGLEQDTTKDLQEFLEKRHVTCFGPDFSIPGRSVAGIVMQQRIYEVKHELEDARWGIMKAAEGEFLFADNFSYGRVVPISPVMCLISASDSGTLSEGQVAWLNRLAISGSRDYSFARDFSLCPL